MEGARRFLASLAETRERRGRGDPNEMWRVMLRQNFRDAETGIIGKNGEAPIIAGARTGRKVRRTLLSIAKQIRPWAPSHEPSAGEGKQVFSVLAEIRPPPWHYLPTR